MQYNVTVSCENSVGSDWWNMSTIVICAFFFIVDVFIQFCFAVMNVAIKKREKREAFV